MMAAGGVNFHFASIRHNPAWFTENFGIEFRKDFDDLEDFKFASIQVKEFVIGILQYESRANDGVYLFIDTTNKNRLEALLAFNEAFSISSVDVVWTHASASL